MRAEVELYANRTSPLHRWDARYKTVSLGFLVAVLVTLHTIPVAAGAAFGALALLFAGGLPVRVLLARFAAAQALLLPCFLILPFTFTSAPVAAGPVTVSLEGVRVAGLLYLRAVAILAVMMAVVYTTPMVVLLRALQGLKLPRVLVEVALLTYRYLFSLWWELTRMRWALATRCFSSRPAVAAYRSLAGVVGVSLVRSVERTERIQHAMHCRGFQGTLRTLHRFEAGVGDGVKCIVCLTFGGFLWWLDRFG